MDVTLLKVLLVVAMALITIVFGVIPLKVMRILANRAHDSTRMPSRWPSLITSLLSCFAGGVFLGVCFLDLLPAANNSLATLEHKTGQLFTYPFVEALACVGFLFVFLIEEVVVKFFPNMFHVHNLDNDDHHRSHRPSFKDQTLSTTADQLSIDAASEDVAEPERCVDDQESAVIRMHRRPHAHSHAIRSVTLMLALSFHAVLEGFAFGFQDSEFSATSLFFGLIVHKSILAFSVGMQLARTHAKRRILVVLLIIMFASMSPIGGGVGIGIQASGIDVGTKEWITTVLMSLAVGTFIYITFFEILMTERDNEHPNLAKLAAVTTGFTLIALLMIADPDIESVNDTQAATITFAYLSVLVHRERLQRHHCQAVQQPSHSQSPHDKTDRGQQHTPIQPTRSISVDSFEEGEESKFYGLVDQTVHNLHEVLPLKAGYIVAAVLREIRYMIHS